MEPRQYSKSEIRAVRIFLVVLLAIGMFSLMGGIGNLHKWPTNNNEQNVTAAAKSNAVDKSIDGQMSRKEKGRSYGSVLLMYCIFSAVFLALASAGVLAVRKVMANGMNDVEFDPVESTAEQGAQPDAFGAGHAQTLTIKRIPLNDLYGCLLLRQCMRPSERFWG